MPSNILLSALLFGTSALGLRSTINQQCFTQYSTISPKTLTTTDYDTSTTQTATKIVTVIPHATVTPSAITSFVTTTSTNTGTVTASTTTDTYTTSQYVTSTSTTTDTSSYVQTATTSTVVTISSTTTVAAPAGFTAISNEQGYYSKREAAVERRSAIVENRAAASTNFILPTIAPAALNARAARKAATSRVQHPYAVDCTRSVTFFKTVTHTMTAPTSTSTLPVPTSFSTITINATATVTDIPADVTSISTVIVSESTTVTAVTSTTSTTTTTNTIYAPSATFLAQCASNNAISSDVGQKIGTVSYNPSFVLQSLYTQDPTGYACCAQCATTQNCAGYAQAPASSGGACYYIITDGRCSNQQSFGDQYHYYNTNGNGYTVGNGQCGYLGAVAGAVSTS